MKIIEFAGDASQVQWPAAYEREIAALSPIEQLRYFYTTPDYERHTRKAVEEGGYEWQNPYCLYTLPVEAVELVDGKIAAAHIVGSRLVLDETVCTYYASDNNGSGCNDREDYAHLCCVAPEKETE